MKYTVAQIVVRDGKLNLVYRAKRGHEFFWVENIMDNDVLWESKEGAERFARLKEGRAIIPESLKEVH